MYCPPGPEQNVVPLQQLSFKAQAVLAAHDVNGEVIDFDIQTKSFDSVQFTAFLANLRSIYPKRKIIHCFIDNARIHHANSVKDYCKNNKIELHFNSAYSSEFQPCEYLWHL